jgi:hypothetical protein
MDLLTTVLPYYIEVALQKDMSVVRLSMVYLIRCFMSHLRSMVFGLSILRTFCLLRVFSPFRYNSTLLLCVPFLFNVSSPTNVRSRESSTIKVMYLSFRRFLTFAGRSPGARIFRIHGHHRLEHPSVRARPLLIMLA